MTAFRASTPSLENARGNYRVLEIKNMKLVERVERAPTFSDVSFGTYKMLSPDVAPTRKSAVEPDWVQGACGASPFAIARDPVDGSYALILHGRRLQLRHVDGR